MRTNLPKASPSVFVFIKLDKTECNYYAISKLFRGVVARLDFNIGITALRQLVCSHTLRHTYASWLVMRGKPLYTVQRLLGHQSSAMTERYSHLAPDYLREAVKGLDEGLSEHKGDKTGRDRENTG